MLPKSDSSGQSGSPAAPVVENPLLASILDQLACPACFGALHLEEHQLRCDGCGRAYPIIDGIPVLIAESIEQPRSES